MKGNEICVCQVSDIVFNAKHYTCMSCVYILLVGEYMCMLCLCTQILCTVWHKNVQTVQYILLLASCQNDVHSTSNLLVFDLIGNASWAMHCC